MTDWTKPCLNIGTGRGKRTKKQPQTFKQFIAEVEAAKPQLKPGNGQHPNSRANLRPVTKPTPMPPERRCLFIKSDGEQCKQWQMRGATRCAAHGGYRQNPTHPATVRLLKRGLLHERQKAKDELHTLTTTIPKQIRKEVEAIITQGRRPKAADTLQACQAYMIDDNGKAWRRYLSRIDKEK